MNRRMTKSDIRAWRNRWQRVNDFTIQEARDATPGERLRDLEMLYDFAFTLNGPKTDDEDAIEDRRRWLRLKEQNRAR